MLCLLEKSSKNKDIAEFSANLFSHLLFASYLGCCSRSTANLHDLCFTLDLWQSSAFIALSAMLTPIITYSIYFITLSIFIFWHQFYGWQTFPWVMTELPPYSFPSTCIKTTCWNLLAQNCHSMEWKEQIKMLINFADLMVELSQSYYPSLLLAGVLSSKSPRKKYILLKRYNKI